MRNSQTMKQKILCLTEIIENADVNYRWRITGYKHFGGFAGHEHIHKSLIGNDLNLSDTNPFGAVNVRLSPQTSKFS